MHPENSPSVQLQMAYLNIQVQANIKNVNESLKTNLKEI